VVFSKTKKLALTTILTMFATMAVGVAQDPPAPAAKPQKVAKDQAEANLINSIPKETDPAKRLTILDQWSKEYPESAYSVERTAEYMRAYTDLKDCKGQSKIAAQLIAADANSESGHRIIISCIYQIKGPDASDFQLAEKTANSLVAHADSIYSDANKPAATTPADWQKFKSTMVLAAKNTIPYIDAQRKDEAKEEADLIAILKADPSDAQASVMLGQLLFSQRVAKPLNQPIVIFEYERAGVYNGPNALPAAAQTQMQNTAAKFYTQYHGSTEGWDAIVALAKTNALPPDGWTIKSTADLAIEAQKAQEAADAADPVTALWRTIKDGLTGADAAMFWESVKDSGLPSADGSKKFKGKLVSQKPTLNPKTLLIAVKDPAGDVTLQLETPLRGKMDPGAELEFFGSAKAYAPSPYMLTLAIADPKTDILGWKSLPIAPTTKKSAPGVKKQAQ